jgi:hypothetical protein
MHDTNEQVRLREVDNALHIYMHAIAQLPYPACFEFIHGAFEELTENDFHIPSKAWLNPYEVAHLVNYVALYGNTENNYRPRF